MKKITFEGQEYEPFALVTYLIGQFTDPGRKVDPRIKPLLDKKSALLTAIENNLSKFKEESAVQFFFNAESKKLEWTEASNLLAHLLCAQLKFGGVKPFGMTQSSRRLQALMRGEVINKVGGGSAPTSIILDPTEPVCELTEVDKFRLIVSRLKDNPNKERARLDDLIEVLKAIKNNDLTMEMLVRGRSREGVAEVDWEEDSLMAYLGDHLKDLERSYGKEAVTCLLIHLPKVALIDLKDHYADQEGVDTPVTTMMKNIRSFSDFTKMSSVIMSFDELKRVNDVYLKSPTRVAGAQVYDAATAFIAATESKDLTALGAVVQQGLDDAYFALLRLTESRKLAMAWFLKIDPESEHMVEAKAIIKHLFCGKSMNAPLFCREVKALLQQNRHADAIRLCAAADRRHFVKALLLADQAVVEMLKADGNPYIALFSDKIQNDPVLKLKALEALDPALALAARPKTVKLADLFGLFSVSAGGCSPDAPHSGREPSPNEATNVFSNKN